MGSKTECRLCRACGGKTAVTDSRNVMIGTLSTIRRKRVCVKCSASYRTLEMPDEIGKDMWEEE